MRVLYLGANLRSSLARPSAPELRALGLKLGLEQAGIEFIPFMAGDEVFSQQAQKIYHGQVKRILPQGITSVLRDIYEIYLDRRFYDAVDHRFKDINPDIILQQHARYGQTGVRLGRRYGKPVFLDDITPIWEEELHTGRSLKLIARQIRKTVFNQASGLLAVSRDMEERLLAEGVPGQKIYFTPNGVDCALFNPASTSAIIRQKYGLEGKVVIGYVGGFTQWHGLDLFMQAAFSLIDQVPNIHFILVGEDTDGRVTSLAKERGLSDKFTFPGRIAHLDVPLYLMAMDIAVLPRTLSYMSPMKIYEYLAMGKPVIAPNNNSIVEEVVFQNQNGFLFEAENVDSMKNAILNLAVDSDLRQKMGTEARIMAQSRYSWFHQTQELIRAFKSISRQSDSVN